ncbi:PUB domain containing protein [Diplonema papillatum]|nr:PUB domain containing protein [Diplonema papillatum]
MGLLEDVQKLAEMKTAGLLTDEEFTAAKAKLHSEGQPPSASPKPAPAAVPRPAAKSTGPPDLGTHDTMGLLEDVQKLAEMKTAGLLTDEEFTAAKAKLLSEGQPPSASPKPAPAAVPRPAAKPTGPPDLAHMVRNEEASDMQVQDAVDTLAKLLNNIVMKPAEPKYRRLKLANGQLQEKVWSVGGTQQFMASLGFFTTTVDDAEVFLLEDSAVDTDLLTGAVAQLYKVPLMRQSRQREAKRRRMADEVRAEVREKAVAEGTIVNFARKQLLSSDDLLETADCLRRVLSQVVNHPDEPRYRRVHITEKFRENCWGRPGAQELLISIAKWKHVPGPPGFGDGDVIELDEASAAEQRHALEFLDATVADWHEQQEREAEETRRAAREEVRNVVRQYRKDKDGAAQPVPPPAQDAAEGSSGRKIAMKDVARYLQGEEVDATLPDGTTIRTRRA